jgi:Transposase DDE domain group 1
VPDRRTERRLGGACSPSLGNFGDGEPDQGSQLELFADRTSSHTFKANQLRLWLSSFAYVLIEALRRLGLRKTALANATAGSIRLKLIKIGALISVSVRRVKVAMSSAHPHQAEFAAAFHALGAAVRA